MKHTILLVDDEPLITQTLTDLLEDEYEIISSNDPLEALDYCKKSKKIDMIISDHMMPKLNGCEFLAEAQHIQPDSYRMILTGYGDAKELLKGQTSGVVQKILIKPWDPDILLTLIKNYIN